MRNHATRLGGRVASFGFIVAVVGATWAGVARAEDALSTPAVVRVPLNDHVTPGNLARLRAGSATARDLLDCLERVPDTVITVRANPLLIQTERLLGRGRFWVVGHRLFGLLEYQAEPAGSHRALRVLAHELAHALEVATLPRGRDISSLRAQIEVRELDDGFDLAPGIETDFARMVSDCVHMEIWRRLPDGTSALMANARLSHVQLPPLEKTPAPPRQ